MSQYEDRLKDYVDVKERIRLFYEKHPDGRLVTGEVTLTTEPDGVPRVMVQALAYRSPDDTHPGVGWSWLELPGKTPYTRGSEIENAETSAWGREIAALGFEVKRGIATKEDARNKQPEQGERGRMHGKRPPATTPAPVSPSRTPEENAVLDEILALPGMTHEKMRNWADVVGVPKGERATLAQLLAILDFATAAESAVPDAPSQPTLEDVLAVTGGEEVT